VARPDVTEREAPLIVRVRGISFRAWAASRRFTGRTGYLMWAFIHNLYLIGWGNRLGTLYTWVRGMAFARNRANRLITFEQANEETERLPGKPA
jgi:hypothetical protein